MDSNATRPLSRFGLLLMQQEQVLRSGARRVSQLHVTGYLAAIAAKHCALCSAPPSKDCHSPLCFQICRSPAQLRDPGLPQRLSCFPGPPLPP